MHFSFTFWQRADEYLPKINNNAERQLKPVPFKESGKAMSKFKNVPAIITEGNSIEKAAEKLQATSDKVSCWSKRWIIKLNEAKFHSREHQK